MKAPLYLLATCLGPALATVHGQFSAAIPNAPVKAGKTSSVTLPSPAASFLMGVDDCNSAHTPLGAGSIPMIPGVPFTTGATGITGQLESICFFASTTGIAGDVWFDWTSEVAGIATLRTCGGGTLDTKVAIWPMVGCPADGTALACSDDSCGLQTEVSWNTDANTTYTIQIGLSPGAPGGSGTFYIESEGFRCVDRLDGGTSSNAIGLVAGGEIGWLQGFPCAGNYDAVETAYGSTAGTGTPTDGALSRIAVYRQQSGSPNGLSGLVRLALVNTVVTNAGTDLFHKVPLGTRIHRSSLPSHLWTWIMATAVHAPGEFLAPLDGTFATPNAWVVGSTTGTLDTLGLFANDVPPVRIAALGLPGSWLLRVTCDDPTCSIGTKLCYGVLCPCGNNASPGQGCVNGLGFGAVLEATGFASVSSDTMSLIADGVINDSGLFFQGNNTIGGGTGVPFGDGLRCCGNGVVRIQVVNPPGTTSPATAQMTETATTNGPNGTITPGTTKCYQYWYRDPATSPCGALFNLTNAVTVTWLP